MNRESNELLKKALALPADQRAELAGCLIDSLDTAEDQTVKAAWDEEIVRRMQDLDSGAVKPISLEQFRQRLKSAIE